MTRLSNAKIVFACRLKGVVYLFSKGVTNTARGIKYLPCKPESRLEP